MRRGPAPLAEAETRERAPGATGGPARGGGAVTPHAEVCVRASDVGLAPPRSRAASLLAEAETRERAPGATGGPARGGGAVTPHAEVCVRA